MLLYQMPLATLLQAFALQALLLPQLHLLLPIQLPLPTLLMPLTPLVQKQKVQTLCLVTSGQVKRLRLAI
ncbi:MAG: hypothetical protein EBU30_02995 [Synechococcaceae bacterium WB6_3B_236]|nr:hypothetical protein [Synechococcaceae bacterium WB6_3B_236]